MILLQSVETLKIWLKSE